MPVRSRDVLDRVPALARRGLRGVKLVISDAHERLKAAVAKELDATWQRCRVHFLRAHAGKSGRRVVAAFIGRSRLGPMHTSNVHPKPVVIVIVFRRA